MSMPINSVRFLLLATVVTGVGVGLSVSGHTHRIVASLFFGVATGLLLRSAFDIRLARRMREQPAGGELSGKDFLWPLFARNR